MTRRALLLLVAAAALDAQDPAVRLDATLQNRPGFMGAVLVAKDGKPVIMRGYGKANLEWDIANTSTTKFRLGSVSKQFTAAAILVLEQQGKLSVSDLISKHLPDTPPAWQHITIHQLLTHTSGIPNFTAQPFYQTDMTLPAPLRTFFGVKGMPLRFDPGTKWEYSNSGYGLLGLIVEAASGMKYGRFMREHIFDPLEMTDTGEEALLDLLPHRAAGYRRDGDKFRNATYLHMSWPLGAGSLYSTLEDLLKWDRALNTDQLLSAASRAKMFTPVLGDYAYGWGIRKEQGRAVQAHSGGINGFSTHLARFPDDGVLVVVLSNVENAAAGRVAGDLIRIVFDTPKP
ncbi:MAG: serine hydrolase domain-containing protein [Bryobacteraceae bacterium]|nr:serine hydrolase domain-containing protein [Bryobacteraceae bacterium]